MCCADLPVLRVAFGEVFALVDVELRLQIRVVIVLAKIVAERGKRRRVCCVEMVRYR